MTSCFMCPVVNKLDQEPRDEFDVDNGGAGESIAGGVGVVRVQEDDR
jgi:hypothetical protein